MNEVQHIVFYGASGHATALGCALEAHGAARIIAFIDDFRGDQGHAIDGRPIISFESWQKDYRAHACFVAVADPPTKRRLVERVSAAGGIFCDLYDREGSAPTGASVRAGSFIVPPSYVGTNTAIGKHVVVMPMTSIGHDVVIGDYCTVCPSSTIGGHVEIGDSVFIGAGSTIIHGKSGKPLLVGAGATIAAGAVVTKSVPPAATVMGNPARPLRQLAAALKPRDD